MANIQNRETARKLRQSGKTITEIAKKLKTGKTTVSYWCRDIVLTQTQIEKIKQRSKVNGLRGLAIYTEKLRTSRLLRIAEANKLGFEKVKGIDNRDLFIIGLALYWAEGYKKGNEEFGFTNSDPAMIKIIIHWLKKIYDIKKNQLILRISINKIHEARLLPITKAWAKILGISIEQFTKPSLIQSVVKKIYPNNSDYLGTLRVKVRKSSSLRREIMGSLSAFQKYSEYF